MKNLPINTIIENIDGEILHGPDDLIITDMVTRFRSLKHGSLLFDIYHSLDADMIMNANIPPCVLVTDKPLGQSITLDHVTIVKVPNINTAFWKFIDFYRNLFDIPVIGVTGTCGKTTTKEMIVHILSANYRVNSTYKSLNADFRHIGYLLDINDESQVGVFEMGVAAPGDIKRCCRYFKPHIGIITNIGIDHLQAFDSVDSYIKAKAEFIEGLNYKGTLIVNADDANIQKINFSDYKGNLIYFGYSDQANYKISDLRHTIGGLRFTLSYKNKTQDFFVPGHAEFNAYNAAAAVAAAHTLGVDLEQARDRLSSFQNVEKHFQFNKGINGSIVIDDTWSTNPTSTEAALKLLKKLSNGKKTIATLGKMSLLGSQSDKYHTQIGQLAAALKIDELILIGEGAHKIGSGALQNGMNANNIHFCFNSDEAFNVLKSVLDENSIALIKTSMMASFDDLTDRIIINNNRFYQKGG